VGLLAGRDKVWRIASCRNPLGTALPPHALHMPPMLVKWPGPDSQARRQKYPALADPRHNHAGKKGSTTPALSTANRPCPLGVAPAALQLEEDIIVRGILKRLLTELAIF
jgi:hypothetical protein